MDLKLWTSVAMIIGMVIGAGILGLPYAASEVGYINSIVLLVIAAASVCLTMLYVAEIAIVTKKNYQLPGLVDKFLGKTAGSLLFISFVLGVYGSTIAYLTAGGNLISQLFNINQFLAKFLYFVLVYMLVYKGLKTVAKTNLIIGIFMVALIYSLSISLLPQVNTANLESAGYDNMLLAFGVILFACLGSNIIPEVANYMKDDRKKIIKAIIIGTLVYFSVYFLFITSFLGSYGSSLKDVATDNLVGSRYILGTMFALFSMTTSFLANSVMLKDSLLEDYKIKNKTLATVGAIMVPFFITIAVQPGFVEALALTGVYVATIQGVLLSLTVIRARKKYKFRAVPMGNLPLYFLIVVYVALFIIQTISL